MDDITLSLSPSEAHCLLRVLAIAEDLSGIAGIDIDDSGEVTKIACRLIKEVCEKQPEFAKKLAEWTTVLSGQIPKMGTNNL